MLTQIACGGRPPAVCHRQTLQLGRSVTRRCEVLVAAGDVRARAYPDNDGGGRSGRGGRSRQEGDRRHRTQQRNQDDDWDEAAASSEEISIPGMTPEAASTSGAAPLRADQAYGRGPYTPAGPQQERGPGRGYGYGRGGGGGGYERRGGGGGGGRGYGRVGEPRWGGPAQGQQEGGQEAAGGQQRWGAGDAGEGQWRGDGGRGRGDGEGQWRSDSGRGRGDGMRTYRGPREAMSNEALEVRQANNDAVRAAPDWRAVAALLEARGSNLDGENITAMLIKVARGGRPEAASSAEFEALVASLYGWISALVPTLRPKQLATCLYAIAKLELFNAELVAALAERAVDQLGNFNGWEYSNMVWAFGRMNYTPGEEWLNQFVYWSEHRLALFKTIELSNTVGALAKLGHVPGPSWMDAFTVSAAKQVGEFNNLEYVNLIFGLASLGYTGGSNPAAWLEPLVGGPMGANRVAGMRVADLTRTTWALTQFDWKPPAPWLEAASRSFVSQLRYCMPSDLATIAYSLAYLRATPSPDTLKLLAFELSRHWPRLSGDELANVAMSLALWQYRPQTERWLDELVIAARDKLPGSSPDALSKYVSALPLLGQGYRLNQVVAQAQALLDGQQLPQSAEAPAVDAALA